MSLAQRLNELSSANNDGLLDDDEYRVLRQDLFERYSGEPDSIPSSLSGVIHVGHAPSPKHVEFSEGQRPPLRSKGSLVNFFRKAASKLSSPPPSPSHSKSPSKQTSASSLKRALSIPHLRSRKSNSSDLTSPSIRSGNGSASSHKLSITSESDTFSPPMSPVKPTPEAMDDIFDDGGLSTTKDIRQAIVETEREGKKVLEAYDGLELTARRKCESRQHSHRTRRPSNASSPPWPSSPVSAIPPPFQRQRSDSSAYSHDTTSIRSGHTSPGLTRSPSQRTNHRTPPPTSPYGQVASSRPSLGRKNSVSSLASTSTFLSAGGRPKASSLSRSTSHLPSLLVLDEAAPPLPTPPLSLKLDEEALAEIADISKRRADLSAKYEARLQYLRARLKGAELHEKLRNR